MSRRQAEFGSSCAGPIEAFLQFKRALGRKYRTEAAALRLLDAYLAEHHITALQQIDSPIIDAFLASRPREHARSYNHLVGAVRRFFDWTLMQGMVDRNPVTATPRRVNGQRIPYLFRHRRCKTAAQGRAQFAQLFTCPASRTRLRDGVRASFCTVWACGWARSADCWWAMSDSTTPRC